MTPPSARPSIELRLPPPVPAPAPRRPFRAELLLGAATLLLVALWVCSALSLDRSPAGLALCGAVMLPLAVVLAALPWVAAADREVPRPVRRAWRALAVAVATWALAGVIWEAQGRPTLSWADPLHLVFVPMVLWGVLTFPGEPLGRAARLRFGLDAGIVLLSGAAGVWYFLFWPLLASRSDDPLALLVNTVVPVADLVVLFAACVALQRRLDAGGRRALAWVAAALICRFLGDLVYGWEGMTGTYRPGGLTDLTWLTALWALAVGSAVQRRAARAGGLPAHAPALPAADGAPGISVLPYAGVAAAFAFLLAVHGATWSWREDGVIIAVTALTALVLARQLLATRDNARLLRERTERESEARFRSLVQHASDVILVVDREGTVRFASPSAERVLGLAPEALLGAPVAAHVHEDDLRPFGEALSLAATRREPTDAAAVRLRHADGSWRTMECLLTNLLDDPTVRGVVVTSRDMTERAALEAQLVHQAFHDPLTGLANRTLLRDRVEHALARSARRAERVAVLFLDLDDFKTVNDSLGHAVGDQLLTVVAERLLNATRGCDTVARLGGDEFAVLVEHTRGIEDATRVVERILGSLRHEIPLDGTTITVNASIGIARAGDDSTADELLRNADVAMYRAKQRGGSGFEVFVPEMHAELLDRLELEADLRRAVGDGGCAEFRLHYQPIVRLEGGETSGIEALVRWQHPRRGLVAPLDFIPAAETTGLIVPLGRWVVREACRQAAEWERVRGTPLTLTVNISGRQLQHAGLADDVAQALADAGLDPAHLVLEITESVIMQDTEENLAMLHALKALGVRLAIDDFGTGYSSLAYLRRFPIDILKIDKSFVDGVGRGGSDAALARTIVALGDMLALRCVAEGIEVNDQWRHLQDIGCEYGQGYLFARPLSAADAEAVVCAPGSRPRAVTAPSLAVVPA